MAAFSGSYLDLQYTQPVSVKSIYLLRPKRELARVERSSVWLAFVGLTACCRVAVCDQSAEELLKFNIIRWHDEAGLHVSRLIFPEE